MKLAKENYQYFIISAILLLFYLFSDLVFFLNKFDYIYISNLIKDEPYRMFTMHFLHSDFSHLVANIFGIVVVRYIFIKLKCINYNSLFYLIFPIIIIYSIINYIYDNFISNNFITASLGFSGIIYALLSFLLCSSHFGKKLFFNQKFKLVQNFEIRSTIFTLLTIGLFYSLKPNVSMSGHIIGIITGIFLFFIS